MQLDRALRRFFARVRRGSTGGTAADRVPSWEEFRESTDGDRDEYVLSLLRAGDGCLKQKELVELTGMSKATVSRWLDDLEAEGRIERARFGRENVVCLPGVAPESP